MYGNTCLVNNSAIKQSYHFMFSSNLNCIIYDDIGAEIWKMKKYFNKSNMESVTILYNGKTGNSATSYKQLENLDKIYEIKQLKSDWNGHGSEPISERVISLSQTVIKNIIRQPELFPTGRSTIQMQFELEDRSYLEFEIFNEKIIYMMVPKRVYANATVKVMETFDMGMINAIVEEFYGR